MSAPDGPKDARDTVLGGPDRRFPQTTGGLIARLADPAGADGPAVLETLCRRYWKPVYGYIRAAWSKGNEDAKDLAQGFFLWLSEGDTLRRYARERGSFRRWLKVLLRSFVHDQEKSAHALKRGGGRAALDLAGLEDTLPDDRSLAPDEAFDRAWAADVLERALERVRERFARAGRDHQFRAFELYDLGGEASTYAQAAERLGAKEADVRNWLFAVREALRAEARAELAESAAAAEDLEGDWHDALGS